MKKKVLAVLLAGVMAMGMTACGGNTETTTVTPAETKAEEAKEEASEEAAETTEAAETEAAQAGEGVALADLKVGFVHVSDPSDMGYTYNHDRGTKDMAARLGLSEDQIINKYNTPESAECATALRELAEEGCQIIFATSFGFEDYVLEVAAEYPDIQFCHATGYQASTSGLSNVHNYFGEIYQARYLSGIAAGLKTETNMLGYVAAVPYAEVISGYDAFYLGAKSVNPDVQMTVMYTGSWNDPVKEEQTAQALIKAGCDVIGQHCDSTAPATAAEKAGVFHVGYNSDMREAAPNASLTSAVWDWSQYLEYAVTCVMNNEPIDVDWSKGLADGVCDISELNEAIVADGTAEAIEEARAKIESGEWDVFTGPLVDVNGETVVAEGETFKEPASAPSITWILEGITVVE